MQSGQVSFMAIALLCLLGQEAYGQIPRACSDVTSLENLECCPTTSDGVCGQDAGRGQCTDLNLPGYDINSADVRRNWPHYFTKVCKCNGNYAGYDCSRCKFGHYGPDCSESQVLPRRPLATYTDSDWAEFIDTIVQSRSFDSGYVAVLEEAVPGTTNLRMSNVSLYNLFVWLHHFASKDSATPDVSIRLDYAHAGPAFTTWHKYFHLLFEWEIQHMLKSMGHLDYHTFRLPYWDWRIEIQRSTGILSDDLFAEKRLGATRNVSGFPRVFGDIVGDGWNTICWQKFFQICDPNVNTGPLQRCPFTGTNPCSSNNPDWPTSRQVNRAMTFGRYERPPYNFLSRRNYRSFVDANVNFNIRRCRKDRMCFCSPTFDPECSLTKSNGSRLIALKQQMHGTVHTITGAGDLATNLPLDKRGQMDDVVSSPNDPLFMPHHVMVDCMFDEWLERHPDAEYPNDIPVTVPTIGHQPDDFMVPFFPLSTNVDMFTRSRNFGYYCDLPNII
ncbi:tyrosinase-like [Dysidea avara]|uniref:tyrosinase-like n=1 Tax=Dysidea avara TaxID=196820 RepID=UPI00331A6298